MRICLFYLPDSLLPVDILSMDAVSLSSRRMFMFSVSLE